MKWIMFLVTKLGNDFKFARVYFGSGSVVRDVLGRRGSYSGRLVKKLSMLMSMKVLPKLIWMMLVKPERRNKKRMRVCRINTRFFRMHVWIRSLLVRTSEEVCFTARTSTFHRGLVGTEILNWLNARRTLNRILRMLLIWSSIVWKWIQKKNASMLFLTLTISGISDRSKIHQIRVWVQDWMAERSKALD